MKWSCGTWNWNYDSSKSNCRDIKLELQKVAVPLKLSIMTHQNQTGVTSNWSNGKLHFSCSYPLFTFEYWQLNTLEIKYLYHILHTHNSVGKRHLSKMKWHGMYLCLSFYNCFWRKEERIYVYLSLASITDIKVQLIESGFLVFKKHNPHFVVWKPFSLPTQNIEQPQTSTTTQTAGKLEHSSFTTSLR